MDISQAYNKTLELEGLLSLLQSENSDDAKIEAIFNNLFNKIDEIDAELIELRQQFKSVADAPVITTIEEKVEELDEIADEPEVVESHSHVEIEEPSVDVEPDINEVVPEIDDEPEEIETNDTSSEEIETNDTTSEEIESNDDEPEVVETNDDDASEEYEAELEETIEPEECDDSLEPDIKVEFECVDVDVNQSAFAHKSRGDIRKMFTLNDNYKFRRELFDNSQQSFAQALSDIENMESLTEAEDYFYNELNWDKDNLEVKEFMSIVAVYFMGK